MTRAIHISIAISILLAAGLACRLLPPAEPTIAPEDAIATSVAATLAASDGSAAPEESAVPPEESAPEAPPLLQVAFVKDGDVWYWQEGGVPTLLADLNNVVQVSLSDDGQLIVFVRENDYYYQEIYAVNTDGSNLRPLVSLADFETMVTDPAAVSAVPFRIDWVPGTHTLAFNTRQTFEGPGLMLPDDLRLVDADTGTQSILLAPGSGGNFYFSPDGSAIALVTGTQISVVNSDGSGRRELLSFPMVITYSEYIYYPTVYWSQDGSFLRTAIPPHESLAVPAQPTAIWHLPADGSPPSTLLSMVMVPFFQQAAVISPDRSQVAFLTDVSPDTPAILDLHIANLDGSSDVIYTNGSYRFDGWSQDSEHFLYTENGQNPRVGRLGDSPQLFSGITLMVNPRWVDANRFLYLNRLSSSWELWLGDQGGAPASLLASTAGEDMISYDFIN
jgi:dipeptidyl aminopeptidase/acylaminoacyl peptidase